MKRDTFARHAMVLCCALAAPVVQAKDVAREPATTAQATTSHMEPTARDEDPSGADGGRGGTDRRRLTYGVDDLLLEAGTLPNADEASRSATARASAYVLWRPERSLELRAGARLDGVTQNGGVADYSDWQTSLTDTYVRWRSGDMRLTAGAQTIVWGRVDAVPLIDRVSRADLRRFMLDDLADRRLAQWALRWEQSWNDVKLDAVVLPAFQGAKLPDERSVWSSINRTTGEVIGIAPTPELAALAKTAPIYEDDSGSGGGGIRLTQTGDGLDWGVTLARTRQSLPYYRLDPLAPSFTAIHPYNNFAGLDAEWVTDEITWRTELGYTADVPVTLPNAAMAMADAVEWVGAVELFPGGGNTRVNLQLLARSLRTNEQILELKTYVGVNGELESEFAQGRWKAGLRFALGLNVNDVYLAPALRFVGWEPHEIYLVGHFFNGDTRTLGGFHRNHDYIAVGWRTRF